MAKRGRQGEGGGRPKAVLKPAQVTKLEALAAVLSKKQIADYFDISESCLRDIEKRQPEVLTAYKNGRAKALATVGGNLLKQAREGNIAAAIFYLKTQGGWREKTEIDISNDDGSLTPDTVRFVSVLAEKDGD